MKKLLQNWQVLKQHAPDIEHAEIENYTAHLIENSAAILLRLPYLPPDDQEYIVAGFTAGRITTLVRASDAMDADNFFFKITEEF